MKNNKTLTYNILLLSLITFSIELLFRLLSNYSIFSYATFRILISCIIISSIVGFISYITKKRIINNIITITFILLYSIYSWLQIGFLKFLGVYISLNATSQLGAVSNYVIEFLKSISIINYLLFIPLVLYVIVIIIFKNKYVYQRVNLKYFIKLVVLVIILITIYILSLFLNFMKPKYQVKSNWELFKYVSIPTTAINQLGTNIYLLRDIHNYLLPHNKYINNSIYGSKNYNGESDYLYRVLENNDKYSDITNYLLSQDIDSGNDYTGMFKGKNLILILMESTNNAMIGKEDYPNFNFLYNNGWHWSNNYSPRNSCSTGNNEFSALTSLYSIYDICTPKEYMNNKYFESLYNLFNNKGYSTSGMHDYKEVYYKRAVYHPNLGAQKYYNSFDLFPGKDIFFGEWASDDEFFDAATDRLLSGDNPFMSFLITVTAHGPYGLDLNVGSIYKNYFVNQGYSSNASNYLSKLKVFDNGLGTLIAKLKESNKLDDTVIVLFGDHYPYSLEDEEVKSMINHSISDYEIERVPFIIYNPSIEPKDFKEYTSFINITPTLANLFGLDYDPRLYMGRDILDESYESVVSFADGSWKNENGYYNASTGKSKCFNDKCNKDYILDMNYKINLKMEVSKRIIVNDYFNYLHNKLNK